MILGDDVKVCREPYWEELTTEQRVFKLGEVVELLWRRVKTVETENAKLRRHVHVGTELAFKDDLNGLDGYFYEPIQHVPRQR